MLEELYKEIPERHLYDNYLNINKRVIVNGTAPASYSGKLFTIDPHSPNFYNFTNSFLAYMNHNKKSLLFKFSVVTLPAFLIFYLDKSNPNNLILLSKPDLVHTYKLPLSAIETYLFSLNMSNVASFYDRILSEINHLVKMKGLDKQLYFYSLTGVKNPATDVFTFMMRGSINIKDMSH